MDKILGGLVLINGTDIWKEYGVFLTEEKKGGRENLNAILSPSKTKEHVGVDIREHDGKKYSGGLFLPMRRGTSRYTSRSMLRHGLSGLQTTWPLSAF